jgi:EmrB/QacA subfamily drug resistance transporter
MTLSASMILVDQTAVPLATPHVVNDLGAQIDQGPWVLTANILPLAAFMVLGGRLGDMFGLRRVFLVGAVIFAAATTLAGFAQDMPWMIGARVAQGTGAALMMPTSVAIVSSVFPDERRGTALGVLAGGSAFFAALGPVLGGVLTSIDWRLVFLINVPLAVAAIVMTRAATPRLEPRADVDRRIDWAGVVTFALGIAALVFGLQQGEAGSWADTGTVVPLAAGVASLIAFVAVERRAPNPIIQFRLFRHLNFLAANVSQIVAGMVELGLGFLLPFYLLLVIGASPTTAGLALIPGTVPIILAGPLAGRAFDRWGGRWPLVIGFGVLAASGAALAIGASDETVAALIPGLVLQGIGLGVVLTTNDPTGLTALPDSDQGEGAGIINTSEQFGGALGIAALGAIELSYYFSELNDTLASHGFHPTSHQFDVYRDFILQAEQTGLKEALQHTGHQRLIHAGLESTVSAHVSAFELAFSVSAGLALVGALVMLLLVRRSDRVAKGQIFSRRSRWYAMTSGRSPAVTRRPAP